MSNVIELRGTIPVYDWSDVAMPLPPAPIVHIASFGGMYAVVIGSEGLDSYSDTQRHLGLYDHRAYAIGVARSAARHFGLALYGVDALPLATGVA